MWRVIVTCKLVTDSIKVSILKRIYDYIPILVETGSFIVTVLPLLIGIKKTLPKISELFSGRDTQVNR